MQTYVNLDGHISVVSAIQLVRHARTGPRLRKPATRTAPTSSVLEIRKRMFFYSIVRMVPRVGLDLMTEIQRELLFGLIISLTILLTGQRINPTTSTMKTVFTPWE